MKMSFRVQAAVACLFALAVGCSQPDVVNDSAKLGSENEIIKSEIALKEEELGITYFKKNVTIADQSGENKIVMQFASLNEAALVGYLATIKYEIIPVYKNQANVESQTPLPDKSQNENLDIPKSEYPIITEEVSRQLKEGVTGFWLKVKPDLKNARTNRTYRYSASHVSEDWPERLHFTLNSMQDYSQIDGVHYFVKTKNGGVFASWKTPSQLYRISPYPGTVPNNISYAYSSAPYGDDYIYELDGPKKVELFVDFNYIGEYSFWFQQL